jgi:hypothetical protein
MIAGIEIDTMIIETVRTIHHHIEEIVVIEEIIDQVRIAHHHTLLLIDQAIHHVFIDVTLQPQRFQTL